MPPLISIEIRRRIELALSRWSGMTDVTWTQLADKWVRKNLGNWTMKGLVQLLHEHVKADGLIKQIPETRPEYPEGCHYDFVVSVGGHSVYVESLLDDDDPESPQVHIVNVHWGHK